MPNLLESIITLRIDSKKYKFEGKFTRRITLIHGDSATGKSSLTEMVKIKSTDVIVECPLKILALADDTWESTIIANENALIIADDLRCVESKKFADMCSKHLVKNNLYIVIINRAHLTNFSSSMVNGNGEHLDRLSISLNSIYNFCTDGVNHWLELDSLPAFSDLNNIDYVVTEDTGRGFEFWDNLLNNVKHASAGKDSLIKDLQRFDRSNKILVLLDTAAFGNNLERFKRELINAGYNISICAEYECFEYALLRSNLLRNSPIVQFEFSDLLRFANKFISWEEYFSDLIDRCTYKKFYRCTHGRNAKMSECWLHTCQECNSHVFGKCDMLESVKSECNILERFFRNTEFECLLDLQYLKKLEPEVADDIGKELGSMEFFK